MRGPRARFRPPWWATLGTLLLGGLFVGLGFWQLDRGAQKRALFEAFDSGSNAATVALPPPGAGPLGALRYRRVILQGRYDAAHQVLLDARSHGGQAGYEVLTPLLGDGPAVLVNRGWVPEGADRGQLPGVAVGTGQRRISGYLDMLPRPALSAGAAPAPSPQDPWPRRLLFPTTAEIGAAAGYPVRDFQVLLAADEADGYLRDWRPALMAPQQHLGYAVQWFALAVALVVIYAALNLRRRSAPPP
ncbi:MAG: SURF1 family protein [Gammaproteobacteria bacterium]|nr:MAG: SURF1 family protein [Gammaproteobacteria bacterium]